MCCKSIIFGCSIAAVVAKTMTVAAAKTMTVAVANPLLWATAAFVLPFGAGEHSAWPVSQAAEVDSGLVSDFEAGDMASSFGFGWSSASDQMTGGTSTAAIEVVAGGAAETSFSLRVLGDLQPADGPIWAGAMFFPGTSAFAAADLSSKEEISFWARGDGQTYVVILMSQATGMQPPWQPFVTGTEWQRYTFSLSDFPGLELAGVQGVLFSGGGPSAGEFSFQIDEVVLR